MHHARRPRHLFLAATCACAGLAWLATMLPATAQTAPAKPPASLSGTEKFSTTTAAAQHCPHDTVVWSTFSKSKVFHLSDSKYFGKTRHGAYACEKDAIAAGFHASKR